MEVTDLFLVIRVDYSRNDMEDSTGEIVYIWVFIWVYFETERIEL